MRPPPNLLRRPVLLVGTLAGTLVAGLAGVELVQWAASRHGFPPDRRPGTTGPDVVLLLGSPSRADGGLHPLQEWRVAIAVRSRPSDAALLVVSGGGPVGRPSEAEVMARHARTLGVPADRIVLETRSRNTWENVAFSLPALEGARTITVATSPTHGARVRRYLAQQRPDLATRLVPADDHRFGERPRWKVTTLAYGVARAVHHRVVPGA